MKRQILSAIAVLGKCGGRGLAAQELVGGGAGAVADVVGEVGFDLVVGEGEDGEVVGEAQRQEEVGDGVDGADEVEQGGGDGEFGFGGGGGGAVEVVEGVDLAHGGCAEVGGVAGEFAQQAGFVDFAAAGVVMGRPFGGVWGLATMVYMVFKRPVSMQAV